MRFCDTTLFPGGCYERGETRSKSNNSIMAIARMYHVMRLPGTPEPSIREPGTSWECLTTSAKIQSISRLLLGQSVIIGSSCQLP